MTNYDPPRQYSKRIYIDPETDDGLERIARQLGLLTSRGPTAGEGSKQVLLARLVQAVQQQGDEGVAILRALLNLE